MVPKSSVLQFIFSNISLILLSIMALFFISCERGPSNKQEVSVAQKYVGKYQNKKFPQDFTELKSDSTFYVQTGKRTFTGIYAINGNRLIFGLPNGTGGTSRIDERGITDANGELWTKQ